MATHDKPPVIIVIGRSHQARRLAEAYWKAGHADVAVADADDRDVEAQLVPAGALHILESGKRPLADLLTSAGANAMHVAIPLAPETRPEALGRAMAAMEDKGRKLLVAYPPVCAASFIRLRHMLGTGMAGRLETVVFRVPGGAPAFDADIEGGDVTSAGCIGLSFLALLAGTPIRWTPGPGRTGTAPGDAAPTDSFSAPPAPGTLVLTVEPCHDDADWQLCAVGSDSTLTLSCKGTVHTLWARRRAFERILARFDDVDPLADCVRAMERFLEGQTRHLPTGTAAMLLAHAFDAVGRTFSSGEAPKKPDDSSSARSPLELDLYQKLPLGRGRSAYWEAKFNIETRCNQDCIFCFARNSAMVVTDLDARPGLLCALAGDGISGVMFSGGEPTLNPRLPAFIEEAARAGLRHITVESNAVRFSDPDVVATCRAAGLDTAFVSFHSCRPETVETLTRLEGSFEKTFTGVRNLLAAGVEVNLNCVTNRFNYRELSELARFIARELGEVNTVTFSYVAPLGRAAGRPDIVPPISEAAPYLAEALLLAEQLGLNASVPGRCGIPLCFLPGLERFFVEYRLQDHLPPHRLRLPGDRVKTELCPRCELDPFCQGLWCNYATMYGIEELRRNFARRG
ncbi:MAG: radical SAM protein [Deltaproteobacteria bacterium]|nr:radical SAM protein [Deltaproteobacteria bacterium]